MTDKVMTGYPSIDKPWLKYYSEEAINAPLPELSLYDMLYVRNKDYPKDYALNFYGRKITYSRLFSMIDEAARAFRALGVRPGEIVSIVSVSTVTSVVCFYALNKIGAVSNFLNVLGEEADLQHYFEEAESKIVVTLDLFAEKAVKAAEACEIKKIIVFSIDNDLPMVAKWGYRLKGGTSHGKLDANKRVLSWNAFLAMAKGVPPIAYRKNPHTLCLLAHTGGTTGTPKAVMLDDYAMNAVADGYIHAMMAPRGGVFLNIIIPFVVYGILCCMHIPLVMGFCVAIVPRFEAEKWPEYFRKYHPNYVDAAPSYVSPMVSNPGMEKIDLSKLYSIGVGGDGMNDVFEKEFNAFLKAHDCTVGVDKGYGMTEVCAAAVVGFPNCGRLGSVGIPLPKNNIMIYDRDNQRELAYNEVGEVCLQCPSRMMGYKDNEDETEQLFWTHDDGSQWIHTGDLGYLDEDGFLFLIGRMKRVIMTYATDGVGYKVFPNIPEKILGSHPLVKQSCIVGVEDGSRLVLKAYILLEDTRADIVQVERELRQLCEDEIPSYSRPTFYKFVERFPLTAAGKIDYRALEKEAEMLQTG